MTGPDLQTEASAAVWRALKELGRGTVTVADLIPSSGQSKQVISYVLDDLIKTGWVAVERRRGEQNLYTVLKRGAPAFGPPEYRMWQTARGLRSFSATDIASHGSVEGGAIGTEEARRYCRMLLDGGYLKVIRKARPGVCEARYQLIRNTGPKPPVKRRVTVLVDPNTGDVQLPEALS